MVGAALKQRDQQYIATRDGKTGTWRILATWHMSLDEKNPDDENRLFYVGATRTKENLHIIEPKQYNKGFII